MGRACALALWIVLGAGSANAAGLADYFGTFVGVAKVEDLKKGTTEDRDIEVVIGQEPDGGFRLRWVNTTRVDGRRDVPGVQYRANEIVFEHSADGRYFKEAGTYDPFSTREEMTPLKGDPVRWATLADDGLRVYSFVVLPDGSYELQVYTRVRTEQGMTLRFTRVVDGVLERRIVGDAVLARNEQ